MTNNIKILIAQSNSFIKKFSTMLKIVVEKDYFYTVMLNILYFLKKPINLCLFQNNINYIGTIRSYNCKHKSFPVEFQDKGL